MSDTTDWINAAGSIATCAALIVAVLDQRAALKWKKEELVSQLIKDWEAKPGVQAVFQILDYTGKNLLPTDYGGKTGELVVSSDLLRDSLELPKPRREKTGGQVAKYEPFEHDLRHFFDQFFEGFARFQHCVDAGLVEARAFRPYLRYWCDRMSGAALHHDHTLRALEAFANHFHPGAPRFLKSLETTFVGPEKAVASRAQ